MAARNTSGAAKPTEGSSENKDTSTIAAQVEDTTVAKDGSNDGLGRPSEDNGSSAGPIPHEAGDPSAAEDALNKGNVREGDPGKVVEDGVITELNKGSLDDPPGVLYQQTAQIDTSGLAFGRDASALEEAVVVFGHPIQQEVIAKAPVSDADPQQALVQGVTLLAEQAAKAKADEAKDSDSK